MSRPFTSGSSSARSPGATLFLGLGGGLAILGLILFIPPSRASTRRAWHLFHVNWVFFTGLTGGSMAFVAVQKIPTPSGRA